MLLDPRYTKLGFNLISVQVCTEWTPTDTIDHQVKSPTTISEHLHINSVHGRHLELDEEAAVVKQITKVFFSLLALSFVLHCLDKVKV